MSFDPKNSRFAPGAASPENAIDGTRQDVEPLITPEQLRTRFLFGIPMVAPHKDPLTGKAAIMTDPMIADIIDGAVSTSENDIRIDIFPTKRREKHAFDINLYNQFGYFQLDHRPCTSVDKLSVTPSNGIDVYVVPNDWVEGAYLIRGQVNIVPLTVAFVQGTYIPQQSSGGAAFLQILGNRAWIPAWWQIEYTSGFPDGLMPRVVNEYIGCVAAIEVLSMLAAMYWHTSFSQGLDGISQSVSLPGPQRYAKRIEELELKKKRLLGKLKGMYGYKIFSGTL